mmetsp:Transcript_71940/g.208394  ORF Transcript_71940/g.208394 Transcript_71940/m.208394 type:complete len:247 (-) Transcript_71940:214-954(-)
MGAGALVRQQLEQQKAQRITVTLGAHEVHVLPGLGRQVVNRTRDGRIQIGPQPAGETARAIEVAQNRRPCFRPVVVAQDQDVVCLEVAVRDGHLVHPIQSPHDIGEQPYPIPLRHSPERGPHNQIKHVAQGFLHHDVHGLILLYPIRVGSCVVCHESRQFPQTLTQADLLLKLLDLLLGFRDDLFDSNLETVVEKSCVDDAGIALADLLTLPQVRRGPIFRHARRPVLRQLFNLLRRGLRKARSAG